MKFIILLIVIIFILISFKLFSKKIKRHNDQSNSKEEIIYLKKDPKTNEYKPKE